MSSSAGCAPTLITNKLKSVDDKGTEEDQAEKSTGDSKLGPLQVVSSVFAAGLGVQSSKNRERDFKQGRPGIFIASGIIFTLFFVGAVFTVVQFVLKGAGE
jgi:hypothetical protein